MTLPVEEQRALAAEMFPHEWARAALLTGERGQKARAGLRKRAVYEQALRPLKAAGASCSTCLHKLRNPAGLKGLYCDLQSDFSGYLSVKADGLCTMWSAT